MLTMRGRNQDEQASGVMPILLKTKPTRAVSATNRISMAQSMVAPIPTAAPFTAAMTGFLHSKIASVSWPPVSLTPASISGSDKRERMSSRSGFSDSFNPKTLPVLDKSMPAQKALPAPVTTIASTASSSLACSKAIISSSAMVTVNALSCSGRFRVMVRIRSAIS